MSALIWPLFGHQVLFLNVVQLAHLRKPQGPRPQPLDACNKPRALSRRPKPSATITAPRPDMLSQSYSSGGTSAKSSYVCDLTHNNSIPLIPSAQVSRTELIANIHTGVTANRCVGFPYRTRRRHLLSLTCLEANQYGSYRATIAPAE